ncbi:MAG: type II secretion system minor pseudopilin GspI [Acidiferrobacterales bacterium]|nr:type II secretion system minor pseudopilin GspI [Acidiferrobacterales bacterium]
MQSPNRHRGFVLVELLIALVILALPLAAFTRTINQSIDTTAGLRDRSIALWIAQDQLAVHEIRRDWPDTKTITGAREMAGRNWRWQEKVLATPTPQMRRIEVEVRDADRNDVLARLVGFIRDPNSKP